MDAINGTTVLRRRGRGDCSAARGQYRSLSSHDKWHANGEIYGYDCGELELFRKGTSKLAIVGAHLSTKTNPSEVRVRRVYGEPVGRRPLANYRI